MGIRTGRAHIGALLVLTGFIGCNMTHVTTTWKAPDGGVIRLEKVVAFAVVDDLDTRRTVEHEICERVTRVPCAPAFAVVNDEDRGNIERLSRQVDAAGFDGAIVLRHAGEQTVDTFVPATMPLWGYYGSAWNTVNQPGYTRQDRLVQVETALYSVKDRKLLWAGRTESANPTDVRRTVDEIIAAMVAAMRKEGVLPGE